MSNFFLLNEAIVSKDFESFKEGMYELIGIVKEEGDEFYKHESLYSLSVYEHLCLNYGGFFEKTIAIFIEQLQMSKEYIDCEEVFDKMFAGMLNAFLGIDFSETKISQQRQINNNDSYQKFNFDNLWNVTYRTLWLKREKLFPNLILCGEVKNQISRIGESSQFNQILERLKEFDHACSSWGKAQFNYKEINKQFALRISGESEQTMASYGNERIFSLPTGGTETFELHIKTGDFRFHFYPDNKNHKVFIGYIGKHLRTVSN